MAKHEIELGWIDGCESSVSLAASRGKGVSKSLSIKLIGLQACYKVEDEVAKKTMLFNNAAQAVEAYNDI